MKNISFRKSIKDDLPQLLSWFEGDGNSYHYWTGNDFVFEQAISNLENNLKNHDIDFFSAEIEEYGLVGYYELHNRSTGSISTSVMVVRLVVRPYLRNKGIGKKIIENIILNNSKKSVELYVYEKNYAALQLYKNVGFLCKINGQQEVNPDQDRKLKLHLNL